MELVNSQRCHALPLFLLWSLAIEEELHLLHFWPVLPADLEAGMRELLLPAEQCFA